MTPIERRRGFRRDGYSTLNDIGFDGEWVTPLQILSNNSSGPVIVALHWLDVPSFRDHEAELREQGYLRSMPFNRVVCKALEMCALKRTDIYLTQAFHLLPDERSQRIPDRLVRESFDTITRYELHGRPVIALGRQVARICRQLSIEHIPISHPSRRGPTELEKAKELADAIAKVCPKTSEWHDLTSHFSCS